MNLKIHFFFRLKFSVEFRIFNTLTLTLKGALDNILTFSFWLNFIYQVNIDC